VFVLTNIIPRAMMAANLNADHDTAKRFFETYAIAWREAVAQLAKTIAQTSPPADQAAPASPPASMLNGAPLTPDEIAEELAPWPAPSPIEEAGTTITGTGIVLPGWSCQRCGVFNGEVKERRETCRSCGAPFSGMRTLDARPEQLQTNAAYSNGARKKSPRRSRRQKPAPTTATAEQKEDHGSIEEGRDENERERTDG
jgi:hypothetical protein